MYINIMKEIPEYDDIVIVYHRTDLDGRCSAALCCLWLDLVYGVANEELAKQDTRIHLVGVNYGEDIYNEDWPKLKGKAFVFVLDFTYSAESMKKLNEDHTVVWVDHHPTGIKNMTDVDMKYKFSAVTDAETGKKISAAWLFFQHFVRWPLRDGSTTLYDCSHVQESSIRDVVNYISNWDTYQTDLFWDVDSDVYKFQMAMRKMKNQVRSISEYVNSDWLSLFKGEMIRQVLQQGEVEVRKIEDGYQSLMKHSFDTHFCGYTFRCINASGLGSQAFRTVYNPDRHDGFIFFNFDGALRKWKVELRGAEKQVNLSEIAERYGGGGHVGTAGFRASQLPFDLPVPVDFTSRGTGGGQALVCPHCGQAIDDSNRVDNTWECPRCESELTLTAI